MTHAFVTVAIAFPAGKARDVNAELGKLGNPAVPAVRDKLDANPVIHFMSMTVVGEPPAATAHLVIEASADGSGRAALQSIATAIGAEIRAVLASAGIVVDGNGLVAYLQSHLVDVGPGWLAEPGVLFSGTPGMSVNRIRNEARLTARIGAWLADNPAPRGASALRVLEGVREEIFRDVDFKWAFVAEPAPLLEPAPARSRAARAIALSALRHLLWPLLIPLLVAAAAGLFFLERGWWTVLDVLAVFGAELILVGGGAWLVYRALRKKEETDVASDENPDADRVAAIMAAENATMQNHLAAVSPLKPGLVRELVLRVVLWAVHALAAHAERPGHIVNIGSIHFARWVVLPGTAKLLFFSNYGGTWVSYLEDFIARAAAGLSAIWSNTQDFPRTRRLTQGGAADGERFKRWARRQQIPTRFWYTAYPELTTSRIRTNAAIRHGFAGASTEAAAAEWLLHLAFPVNAGGGLPLDDMPTLAVSGLKRLPHAHALLIRFGPGARDWLRAVEAEDRFLYGEALRPRPSLVVGLSATGLEKVAGDPAVLEGFPTAFQHGMAAPWRARALGDTGDNAPQNWWWGGNGNKVDAILGIYAGDPDALRAELSRRIDELKALGHELAHEVALDPLPAGDIREPFGFIDGISQPVMRGTRRWQPHLGKIHEVEPGEIILGQKDNLGCVTPAPRYHGVDIGSNGTFLVVRQLEQDKRAFDKYLDDAANAIRLGDARLPAYIRSRAELREWIEAKMVGRWKADGSSLVRHPEPPGAPNRVTVRRDNDFLFGAEDPHGLACPFGAHVRRANPRESFDPASDVQVRITNRHRIFRVGRSYSTQGVGLFFMCVNADIEGQFEFLQRTWVLGRSFHGLPDEVDPVAGDRAYGADTMTIPTPNGPLRLTGLANFVTVRGGAYFFLPGRAALRRLLQL